MQGPQKLTGKQFEELILKRGKSLENGGHCTIDRYGVKSSRRPNGKGGFETIAMQSYPDFCLAVQPRGLALDIEAKVRTEASFNFADPSFLKDSQRDFMLRRSAVGVSCWILLHFNARKLKTKSDPPLTVAFPVGRNLPLWQGVLGGTIKNVHRDEALQFGRQVHWGFLGRQQTLTPDIGSLWW